MDNVLTVIVLVILCVLISYYLSQYWVPLGFLGFVGALVIVGVYLYRRNRRIQ